MLEPGVQRGADRPGWGTGGGTREGWWSDVQLEEQPGWLCRACGPWRGLEALSRREGEAGKSEQPCDVLSLTYVFKQLRLLCDK